MTLAPVMRIAEPASRGPQVVLRFSRAGDGRTFLSRQYVAYPFHITRVLRLDRTAPDMATVYLQSASPGLLQGDRVAIDIRVAPGAIAHVTTPSATKIHDMAGGGASQAVELRIADGAHLDWLPGTTVLFPRARLDASLHLGLGTGATAVLVDAFLCHDPARAALSALGHYVSETRIESADGRLLALDRMCFEGLAASAATRSAVATILALGAVPADPLIEALRAAVAGLPGCYAGASALPNGAGAVMRILATGGDTLRSGVTAAWRAAHLALTGRSLEERRK